MADYPFVELDDPRESLYFLIRSPTSQGKPVIDKKLSGMTRH